MAAFRTIEARRAGTCKRCDQEFPVGTKIRWAAGSGSYHLASQCPASPHFDGADLFAPDASTEIATLRARLAELEAAS